MAEHITIPSRFCGPPDSGNGGYVCGRLARYIAGPAEVTLRVPPPLERPLAVERAEDRAARLVDGETLVATGAPAKVDLTPSPPPTFAAAETAAQGYTGFHSHGFPTCFVCGPDREAGDGLRIFAGPMADQNIVAAPWVPDASLAGGDGKVRPEFLWAALDCPGAFALGTSPEREPILLGRLAAHIDGAVAVGERCVLVAWELGRDGRKRTKGTALFGADGTLRAAARATWIVVANPT